MQTCRLGTEFVPDRSIDSVKTYTIRITCQLIEDGYMLLKTACWDSREKRTALEGLLELYPVHPPLHPSHRTCSRWLLARFITR